MRTKSFALAFFFEETASGVVESVPLPAFLTRLDPFILSSAFLLEALGVDDVESSLDLVDLVDFVGGDFLGVFDEDFIADKHFDFAFLNKDRDLFLEIVFFTLAVVSGLVLGRRPRFPAFCSRRWDRKEDCMRGVNVLSSVVCCRVLDKQLRDTHLYTQRPEDGFQ